MRTYTQALRRRRTIRSAVALAALGFLAAGGLAQEAGEILIRGGEVVTVDGRQRADVRVVGETIAEIGPDLTARAAGAEVIDADGLLVLPGGIDPHVHVGGGARRRLHVGIRRRAGRRHHHDLGFQRRRGGRDAAGGHRAGGGFRPCAVDCRRHHPPDHHRPRGGERRHPDGPGRGGPDEHQDIHEPGAVRPGCGGLHRDDGGGARRRPARDDARRGRGDHPDDRRADDGRGAGWAGELRRLASGCGRGRGHPARGGAGRGDPGARVPRAPVVGAGAGGGRGTPPGATCPCTSRRAPSIST